MKRYLGALATILIIPLLYSCKADEVWNNANRPKEYSIFHIISVNATSFTTVRVSFSQEVEIASGEDTANYSIPGLTITGAVRDGIDYTVVNLTTSTHEDINYTLTVTDVMDTSGNMIGSPKSKQFAGDVAPRVLSAVLIDSDTVEVLFSEPMSDATTNVAGNYTIKDSDSTIVGVSTATTQVDASRVRLDIAPATFTLHLYSLTVNTAVTDLNGHNLQGSPKNKASFAGEGSMPETFTDGPVIVDPMDESNNSFSLLVKYRGNVYIGPANSDNAIFRLKPDGSDPQIVTFYFYGESGDSTTLDPGPDGESGIDYIASGLIGGEEHLFFGPQRTAGNLNYIYYTNDTGTQIDFTYIDVNAYTSGPTRSINSMAVFNNMLFLGLSDQGSLKPIFPKLVNLVNNPVTDVDIFGMEAPYFTRIGYSLTTTIFPNMALTVGIDIIYPYNNRLYIANGGNNAVNEDGGIARSINNNPDNWSSGGWIDITPTTDPLWYNAPANNRFSIELSTQYKLIPADRAFPAMAAFNGNLYIARNTTQGPQLWKHDGAATWTLVADDDADGITELGAGHPNNASITMLIANATWLYVGFDNGSNGIQIFRTNNANPLVAADFQTITNDGFGQSSNITTIYHALSIVDSGTYYLWVLCGKDTDVLRVYRTSN